MPYMWAAIQSANLHYLYYKNLPISPLFLSSLSSSLSLSLSDICLFLFFLSISSPFSPDFNTRGPPASSQIRRQHGQTCRRTRPETIPSSPPWSSWFTASDVCKGIGCTPITSLLNKWFILRAIFLRRLLPAPSLARKDPKLHSPSYHHFPWNRWDSMFGCFGYLSSWFLWDWRCSIFYLSRV